VVITSNSEKNLPPAFLRRCTFFHIKNPSDEKLRKILASRLRGLTQEDEFYVEAVALYNRLRKAGLEKSPATAELIAWVAYLRQSGFTSLDDKDAIRASLCVLVKSEDDLRQAINLV
jgi:MoxR-like ATPase